MRLQPRRDEPFLPGRRRLSQGELAILLDGHARFLAGAGGKRAQLPFVDFTGVDLSGRRLAGADFTGSVFDGANLAEANLDGAALAGCDLRGADLRAASLRKADLRGACLQAANLAGADLTEADLRPGVIARPHPTRGFPAVVEEDRELALTEASPAGKERLVAPGLEPHGRGQMTSSRPRAP
jgi:hypothetical protein